jgi:parvulin-like peptidyl-prolyl isomerase
MIKNYARFTIPIFIMISILFLQLWITECSKTDEKKDIIAVVNEQTISMDQFRLFYELDPNFGIDSSGYPALRDELHKYINQIKAYEKAKRNALLKNTVFVRAINWEHRQAMLRQLFRDVVLDEIEVSEDGLRRAYRKQHMRVHVRHLFSRSLQQVRQWQEMLEKGYRFTDLAGEAFNDTVLSRNGGDLGWITLGELDDDFASAVSGLQVGELSDVVKTRWGYHLIELIDRKDAVILSKEEFKRRRPILMKTLRNRKRDQKSAEYIASYIGAMNPQPVQSTFRLLWNAVTDNSDPETEELPVAITFTTQRINELEMKLDLYLDEPLIIFRGGSIALGEYLSALKTIPAGHRPAFQTPRQLSDQMGLWMRDELMFREATERGLDEHTRVNQEVRRFTEEQSYYYFLNSVLDTLQVPKNVKQYFQSDKKKGAPPGMNDSGMHTLQEWRWKRAERILDTILKSVPAEIWIDQEALRKEAERIPWNRTIRMFRVRNPS